MSHDDAPTDRALHALARQYAGCSAYPDGPHAASCPAATGLDDDLPTSAPEAAA